MRHLHGNPSAEPPVPRLPDLPRAALSQSFDEDQVLDRTLGVGRRQARLRWRGDAASDGGLGKPSRCQGLSESVHIVRGQPTPRLYDVDHAAAFSGRFGGCLGQPLGRDLPVLHRLLHEILVEAVVNQAPQAIPDRAGVAV